MYTALNGRCCSFNNSAARRESLPPLIKAKVVAVAGVEFGCVSVSSFEVK